MKAVVLQQSSWHVHLKANAYWLTRQEAVAEARRVAAVVHDWQAHFKAADVAAPAVDALSAQIDRPQLRDDRRALAVFS